MDYQITFSHYQSKDRLRIPYISHLEQNGRRIAFQEPFKTEFGAYNRPVFYLNVKRIFMNVAKKFFKKYYGFVILAQSVKKIAPCPTLTLYINGVRKR